MTVDAVPCAQLSGNEPVRKLTVCGTALFQGIAEEDINPVEGDGTAADDCAGGYRAPQNVGAGEVPNCEQRRKHSHQDAETRNPEGEASDQARIQKAAS